MGFLAVSEELAVLIVRLKQCEVAMGDGRLDEAFELARQPDLRTHRRGQRLITRLSQALIERGRSHLAAGQLLAAAQDCERAAQLGGNTSDVAQLRAAVSNAMADQRNGQQVRDEVLATARRHAQLGQLTVVEQVLATAPSDDPRALMLQRDVTARRAAIRSTAQKAQALVAAGDLDGAIEQLASLDRGCRMDGEIRKITARLSSMLLEQTTVAIEQGQLDRANALLNRYDKLAANPAEAEPLRSALRQCRQAMACIQSGDAARAEQILRPMSRLWPRARWLEEVLSRSQQWREAVDELRAGPLRLVGSAPLSGGAGADPVMAKAHSDQGASGPDFLLHIDGIGAFRVIGKPLITIGPISSPHRADVPLMIDASLPLVTIARSEDDYFLRSRQPVMVNDKPTTSVLLSSGDRIALGPRCRITFRRPSAASTTAVLDLSGTRLPRGDVRQIILLDRELIVGPGASSHVRADDLGAPAVLRHRGGRLVCRAGAMDMELSPGQPVTLGNLGMVIAKEE